MARLSSTTVYGDINISKDIDVSGLSKFSGDVTLESDISIADDKSQFFGSNDDFSASYDSVADELIIRDETNGVDLIRQPKQGSTQFIQGADIGSIEAPEDSFTQLANAAATSGSASGDTIGYTFAVDNQTALEVSATSDGSGGLSEGPIPTTSRVFKHSTDITETLTVDSGEGVVMAGPVTGTGSVTGGGNFTVVRESAQTIENEGDVRDAINNDTDHGSTAPHNYFDGDHASLTNVTSGQHHTKTSSASELTDVSADSVSGAHHSKTTSASGLTDVSSVRYFDAHLTTTQTNAENGIYVNFADSANLNNGFTVNSSSSISVDSAGEYKVEFLVNFHRTGSSGRNIMYTTLELNGTTLDQRARGSGYIRTDGNGDEADTNDSVILSLSAGDTLRLFANEERGGESGNDIERASMNINDVEV